MPEIKKNTLKKRRQRANIRSDLDRLEEYRRKDRERKRQNRNQKKQLLKSHPRLLQVAREKKKLEMRVYREKKKVAEAEEVNSDTRRSIAAKTREAKKKEKTRKAKDRLEKKLEKVEKRKAVLQTQSWRMRIKLGNGKEQEDRGAQPFASPSSEKRAVRKARKTMPPTPQRKARVLQKLVDSPRTLEILKKRGVILSKKTRRTLELGEEVLDSLSEQLDSVKPSGGTQPCKQRAYGILRSIVDKNRKKGITAALRSRLKLRKVKKQKNVTQNNQWWQPSNRKKRKDSISERVKQRVRDFYLSPDISQEVPDKRAAIKVKEGGQVQMVQRQNMCMVLGDAYDLYKKMYPEDKIGLTSFCKLRPL